MGQSRNSKPILAPNPRNLASSHDFVPLFLEHAGDVAREIGYYFMTAVAARTARPLNMDEIARDIGVSAPTVKR